MITVIVNPAAGKGATRGRWSDLARALRDRGVDFRAVLTEGPGHATELARAAVRKDCPTLAVVGGDGIINEVINGIVGKPVTLAVIPTGSGNDFAEMLNLHSVEDGIRGLTAGRPRTVDLGRTAGRYFINILGIGFAAMVAAAFRRKKLPADLAYLASVLETLVGFRPIPLAIDSDTVTGTRRAMMVAVGNGRSHGGMFLLTPRAEIDDGRFDVCIVNQTPVWRFLLSLPRAAKGTHIYEREIDLFQTRRLTISSPQPFDVHLDGELLTERPCRLEIELIARGATVLTL